MPTSNTAAPVPPSVVSELPSCATPQLCHTDCGGHVLHSLVQHPQHPQHSTAVCVSMTHRRSTTHSDSAPCACICVTAPQAGPPSARRSHSLTPPARWSPPIPTRRGATHGPSTARIRLPSGTTHTGTATQHAAQRSPRHGRSPAWQPVPHSTHLTQHAPHTTPPSAAPPYAPGEPSREDSGGALTTGAHWPLAPFLLTPAAAPFAHSRGTPLCPPRCAEFGRTRRNKSAAM